MNFYRIFIFAILLSIFYFLFPPSIFAQSTAGIQVSPPVIQIKGDPGETKEEVVRITNIGEDETPITIQKKNIEGITESGQPIFTEEEEIEEAYGLKNWIEADRDAFILKPLETQEIRLTISIPKDASPGDHIGGVFFLRAAVSPKESGTGIGYAVGAIIETEVSGEIQDEASIKSFYTEKAVYNLPEVIFRVTVENEGNVIVRPRGFINITDVKGKKVGEIRVNDKGSAVLLGGKRTFQETWKGEKASFGRYQASVSLVYGKTERKTISNATSFWIFPFKVVGIVIGGIIFVIGGILMGIRWYIRKRLKEIEILAERVGGYHRGKRMEGAILRKKRKTGMAGLLRTTLIVLFISITLFLLLLFFG
ncbi:hypothetical protein A3A21_01105 [Candidatus Jorgensenbacteria bacterium RIFCSPLOWO2_01_FULL_45_25b]|uniref:DUF916 domain-containing protein n=1 Tax=Candidatus Jorgensenbacteria bacterium RIFCSPLOWO2_01_FULL_45_25b TaxID=1798471 RepID=A0A1F6BV57_9BACT|nr:MAG: hypothetical protein A3A21_01105 [Candidatus Jorgensenbacteria bacterium RIFCSPLOWO2_01_FULL_45_25b]